MRWPLPVNRRAPPFRAANGSRANSFQNAKTQRRKTKTQRLDERESTSNPPTEVRRRQWAKGNPLARIVASLRRCVSKSTGPALGGQDADGACA